MVVIDEQHRFGVNQRLALSSKGEKPHVLLMTATPIPRTLTLTAYGDLECSSLREKPAGRQRIETRAVPIERLDEVVAGIRRAIETGSKVYWICPLVEEAQGSFEGFEGDLAAAEDRFRVFQALFGERVAMAHGKMKGPDRDRSMQGFAGKDFDILVATTVVEVGVDVPDATIIVIEHAERFGLAQLHQLRGRVGRGSKPSSCILLYGKASSEIARKRLRIIRESDDGFYIAEEDLILRGAGDILGTRQSGFPDFHFADLIRHRDLLLTARDDVKMILHQDKELTTPRGKALRVLLYLFEYDSSLRYIEAG
jgi:ATP-dependent DNA helicase RecG